MGDACDVGVLKYPLTSHRMKFFHVCSHIHKMVVGELIIPYCHREYGIIRGARMGLRRGQSPGHRGLRTRRKRNGFRARILLPLASTSTLVGEKYELVARIYYTSSYYPYYELVEYT